MFKPVPKDFDLPALEDAVLALWRERDVEQRYLHKNDTSQDIFKFLDGPITANGQMGVHHAWGRFYKDLWQRYNTMLGKRQRYQNGFDCQGLWVEVTVERELGFQSKRDIEEYGVAEFVRKCKESVFGFAATITAQSRRLGYFMDWDDSYYTLSDENNYTIWQFLKTCHERGLLYLGTDVMPWCTHCGTGISEQEMAEGYEDLRHRSVYVGFPLAGADNESLLVWTTTPWTLTSNVAVAVNPDLPYVKVRQGDDVFYLARGATKALQGPFEVLEEVPGSALLGRHYAGPFDYLPAEQSIEHTVIPWADVSADEGTGLVHIAPGCGAEDFALGKEFGLPSVAPIDQNGVYVDGFGWLTGRSVQDVSEDIIDDLRSQDLLYRVETIEHRYPTCWRCHTPLVFRLVDEWFIAMDPLREPMMEVTRQVRWIPPYGLDRELDWLRNMRDWMISKKRYWGLALPFWICPNNHLTVIGGKEELFERGLSGLEDLESPHRPWIDDVTIRCDTCGEVAHRIPDVGNPWLDAGIVPYSTIDYSSDPDYWREWFPAEFITESFPGQFRNWFYSMLAMSTVLQDTPPFKTVLGYQLMRDEHGREMHKSWGNLIPFDEAAERAGADSMRWLFAEHDPDKNLNFGYGPLEDVKRRLLVLWNSYSFFVTYANVDGWTPAAEAPEPAARALLDRWILARLHELIGEVRSGLDDYDPMDPALAVDRFIDDLSTWYIRRSRRRFWKSETDSDKLAAYSTLYECLTTLTRLMAPFVPFLSETMYQNLVRSTSEDTPVSVHLTDYPVADETLIDRELLDAMSAAQRVVALGRAARDTSGYRVRQPLARISVVTPDAATRAYVHSLSDVILEELNVKALDFAGESDQFMDYAVKPNLPVLGPKYGKRLGGIRRALESLDLAAVVARVQHGQPVTLTVDGEAVQLQPDELLTSARQREGFAAAADDGFLVALDTQLTRDLIHEGWAREVVRRINDWRKAAGFNVDDRIRIAYTASPELHETIEEYHGYISNETLAVELRPGELDASEYQSEATFADQKLAVQMQRASREPIGA